MGRIKIKVHKDQTATLSGVPWQMLQTIITSANIEHLERRKTPKELPKAEDHPNPGYGSGPNSWFDEIIMRNYYLDIAWMDTLTKTLKCIDWAVADYFKSTIPTNADPVYERAERFRKLEEAIKFRAMMKSIFEAVEFRRNARKHTKSTTDSNN